MVRPVELGRLRAPVLPGRIKKGVNILISINKKIILIQEVNNHMNYLQVHNAIFDEIGKIEEKYEVLLQHADDPEALLDFPCESKEDYRQQTGKDISDEDYNIIVYLNGLYNAIYEVDCALDLIGIEY